MAFLGTAAIASFRASFRIVPLAVLEGMVIALFLVSVGAMVEAFLRTAVRNLIRPVVLPALPAAAFVRDRRFGRAVTIIFVVPAVDGSASGAAPFRAGLFGRVFLRLLAAWIKYESADAVSADIAVSESVRMQVRGSTSWRRHLQMAHKIPTNAASAARLTSCSPVAYFTPPS